MIYDISRPISPQTAVWTGDSPFALNAQLAMATGDSVNLTNMVLSPHTATHADAYWHSFDAGLKIHEMPLEKYLGRAQVVTVQTRQGEISPADLPPLDSPIERLLIHTRMSALPETEFHTDFPYPSLALIDWLADQGGVLLGMDSPSMDAYESKELLGHNRLRERGMVHLENLWLALVPDGLYELIALPLKVVGGCGSPVRAILRSL